MRWLFSDGANFHSRAVLGMATRDVTSGYRCCLRQLLEQVEPDGVEAQGYSCQIEMGFRWARLRGSMVELPIRFEDQTAGKSNGLGRRGSQGTPHRGSAAIAPIWRVMPTRGAL